VPTFDDAIITIAPAVAVWKLLYDPLRFPDWWAGIVGSTPGDARGGDADITLWPQSQPDFALPQRVQRSAADQRIVVSCTVTDLVFEWTLEPAGAGTRIGVHVEIPEVEAAREATQRQVITRSLRRLAQLAEQG
jgi:uncharacterized protein YndB with AHSA1/START domain